MLSYLTDTKERTLFSYSIIQGIILAIFFLTATPAQAYNEEHINTKVICVEGYKYLLVWANSGSRRPPSVTQMYERQGKGLPPQPIKCK